MPQAFLGLGSNIGDRMKYLQEAEKTNLADKITAEMYLMFDIFDQHQDLR